MLAWPPRPPGPPPSGPPPEPRFQVLRAIFHHAYLSLPPETWYLPLRQQSEVVLRRVIEVARSYTSVQGARSSRPRPGRVCGGGGDG